MKKFVIFIPGLLLSLFFYGKLIHASANSCYASGCDANTCVNDSCSITAASFMTAYPGDKISLIHPNLNLVKKITIGDTQINSWNLKADTWIEFSLPNTVETGVGFVNMYDSEGGLIAVGDLTIQAGSNSNPAPQSTQPAQPSCSSDTWACDNWGSCSLSGIQSRTCRKTFDCSNIETAPPTADQYCEPANKPVQQMPLSSENANQDTIIKSTVKLICPLDANRGMQGSGTVIDSSGTILTNKHVISGTVGCLVGFISSYGDEPYFGDRQIADITNMSSNEDYAILKLRNPQNQKLPYVDITKGNSNLSLGTKVDIYGYPAIFGANITYTSGDFSGTSGSYLKTTAIIEHGNSGGGAYTSNGAFIGIPSAVIKGELNALGYILSINAINSGLGNSSITYNNNTNNNYSRVSSILDNIDLSSLGSLQLVIPGKESSSTSNNGSATNKPSTSNSSTNLVKRLRGRIVLQVESHGEAWYINPNDGKRYYMKDGPTAYQMMRQFGLGITNVNLTKVPQEGGGKTFPSTFNHLKGRILLQVEANGEAWYVDPKTGYRYYMKDGEAAYNLMRYHSLGITNADLEKIPEGAL